MLCYKTKPKISMGELLTSSGICYNNTRHSCTCKIPFEIIGGHPKIPLLLETNESTFAIDEYVNDVQDAFQKVQERLKEA